MTLLHGQSEIVYHHFLGQFYLRNPHLKWEMHVFQHLFDQVNRQQILRMLFNGYYLNVNVLNFFFFWHKQKCYVCDYGLGINRL